MSDKKNEKELNLSIAKLNGDTLTILHGEAAEHVYPEVIKINGDIKAVSNFLSVRKQAGTGTQAVDLSKALVTVNKKGLTILLELDPESKYGASVKSTLETAEELKPFCINQEKIFTKDELFRLIKFSKLFFTDSVKHEELLKALQKSSSSVSIAAGDSNDERGNKQREFKKQVETNLPHDFMLSIPVFKGFDPYTFKVEICLDVKEGKLEIWLESTELHELKMKEVDNIFKKELEAAEGFVIINQ